MSFELIHNYFMSCKKDFCGRRQGRSNLNYNVMVFVHEGKKMVIDMRPKVDLKQSHMFNVSDEAFAKIREGKTFQRPVQNNTNNDIEPPKDNQTAAIPTTTRQQNFSFFGSSNTIPPQIFPAAPTSYPDVNNGIQFSSPSLSFHTKINEDQESDNFNIQVSDTIPSRFYNEEQNQQSRQQPSFFLQDSTYQANNINNTGYTDFFFQSNTNNNLAPQEDNQNASNPTATTNQTNTDTNTSYTSNSNNTSLFDLFRSCFETDENPFPTYNGYDGFPPFEYFPDSDQFPP